MFAKIERWHNEFGTTGKETLQDLNYTYDPEGNIVQQDDNAQQINYFDNTVIAPVGKYEYDALYRIVKTDGRELIGLGMANNTDFVNDIHAPNAGSDQMQNYTHLYSYDELGNIETVNSQGRWNRNYTYDTNTNRLLNTGPGLNYTYDTHGNMPHLGTMEWDYKGNLTKTIRIGNGYTAYYRYDTQGNRVRKVYIHDNITDERIYIGNYEIYRRKVNGTLDTERETSFVSDDQKRLAIVDTRNLPTPVEVTIRYQYDNHLGSACLELDGSGAIVSYEEYLPFGTTSYRAGRSQTEVELKRYKYVGKERDEETGLYYYGARYYAAWLCRFVSVDPLQFKYPHYTPYQYAGNKPISYIDLDGLEEKRPVLMSSEDIYKNLMNKVKEVHETNDNTKNADLLEATGKISINIISSNKNIKASFLEWQNEQKGIKVDNFGVTRQSPRKSIKTDKFIDVGGKNNRGIYTTRNMGSATKEVSSLRQSAKVLNDFGGTLFDVIDLVQVLREKQSVFAGVNPYSFIVEERIAEVDSQTLEFAISQGYHEVKKLIENCQSCEDIFKDMSLLNVTADELTKLTNGVITDIQSLDQNGRNETLGYAALLNINSKGKIKLVAGFSTKK